MKIPPSNKKIAWNSLQIGGLKETQLFKALSLALIITFTSSQIGLSQDSISLIPKQQPQAEKEISDRGEESLVAPSSGSYLETSQDFLADTLTLTRAEKSIEETALLKPSFDHGEGDAHNDEVVSPGSYEYLEYKFEDAVELIRPEFAVAIPVSSINEEELKKIRSLDVEVALISVKGMKFLLTSGRVNEILTHPVLEDLLDEVSFMAHTHPEKTNSDGPSLQDFSAAGEDAEYVLTPETIISYSREGLQRKNISAGEFLAAWDRVTREEAVNEREARLWANRFIVEVDRLNNEAEKLQILNLRASGTVTPDPTLTSSSVTSFSGSPWVMVMNGSSASTNLIQQSNTQFQMNYDITTPGAKSGAYVSFDNPTTSGVEVQNLSALTTLTVGLKGPAGANVRFEVEDSLGAKAGVDLVNVSSAIQYYKISKTLFTGIDWSRITRFTYSIDGTLTSVLNGTVTIQTKTLLYSATALTNLPNTPFLEIAAGSNSATNVIEASNAQFKFNYDLTTAGSISGTSIVLDNPSTTATEVANFSTLSGFTFGFSGPPGASLKLEVEDALGVKSSTILIGLTSGVQYYSVLKTLFTGVNWSQIKRINIYAQRDTGIPVTGTITVHAKTLTFSTSLLTNLPNTPYLSLLSGASVNTSLVETGSTSFKLNYDVTAAGSVSGASIVLDNPATTAVETANLSTLTQFTFGIAGPANGKIKVEFQDATGTKSSIVVTGLGTATQYHTVSKNAFAGVNWTQIKQINFSVDGTMVSPLTGTITIQAKTLAFSTAILTDFPAVSAPKILQGSTAGTMVRQGTNASFALDFSLLGAGTKSGAVIDFDNAGTPAVEAQNFSGLSQFVFSASGVANGKVKIEFEDLAGAKASTILSGLTTSAQYYVVSAQLFSGIDLSKIGRIIFSVDPTLTALAAGTLSIGIKTLPYSGAVATTLPGNPMPLVLQGASSTTFLTATTSSQMRLNYDVTGAGSNGGLSFSFDDVATVQVETKDLSAGNSLTFGLQGGTSNLLKIKLEIEDINGTKAVQLLPLTTTNTYVTVQKALLAGIDWTKIKRINFVVDQSMANATAAYKNNVQITVNGFLYTPTVLATAGLTNTSVTTLSGTPSLFMLPGSSPDTLLANTVTGFNLNYNVSTQGISGARINFDKSATIPVETVNLSSTSTLTFGLKSPVNSVRMEMLDSSGKKSSILLANVSTAETFFRVSLSSFTGIDKANIQAIQFVIDPALANNSAKTGTLEVSIKGMVAPVLSEVVLIPSSNETDQSTFTIFGSKGPGTGVVINGSMVVPPSDSGTWQAVVSLPAEGEHVFQFRETNGAGSVGPIIEARINRIPVLPQIKSISIDEGAIVSIPYLNVSYESVYQGVTTIKYKEVDLQEGLNTVELREANSLGQEVVIQRHIYYVPEALDPALKVLRDRYIQENSKYFQEGQGIDPASGFPIDVVGTNAVAGTQWTQPTSIGFYLQFLGEIITKRIQVSFMTPAQAMTQANKVLDSLGQAQTQWGWKGLIPWMTIKPVLAANTSKVALIDNANLTQSIVSFLGALNRANLGQTTATNLNSKAEIFLANQRDGYQAFVDAPSGVFRATYDKSNGTFDSYADRFGSEIRSAIPFLIQFFGLSDSVWNNLIRSTSRSVTEEGRVVKTFSAFDGGGFQYFWPLINSPEESLPQISAMLQNAFLIHQDVMNEKGLPGFLSASSLPEGGYSGKIGVSDLKETPSVLDEGVGSVYSLAAAYKLNPQFVLTKLQEIEASFPNLKGALGFYDAARSNTAVSQNYYAIDQGSMVLGLAGGGGEDFKFWLQKKGLWQAYQGYYSGLNFGIAQAVQSLPEPELSFDEIHQNHPNTGNVYNSLYDFDQFSGNGISVLPQADGAFLYTPANGTGWIGGSITPSIDLDDYAFVNLQIRSTSATGGQVDFEVKNGSAYITKKTLPLPGTEWQNFQFFFPKTSPDVNYLGFAKASKAFEVRQITFNDQPVFSNNFPPAVELKSEAITNKTNYLLQYTINGVMYEERVALVNGANNLARNFTDAFGRQYRHVFNVTYDGAGPVVLLVSGFSSTSSNYVLAYTVDGNRIEENIVLQEGENLLVRSAADNAGNTTTKTFRVVLDSKPPVIQSFRINQGDAATKSSSVNLDILAFDLGSTVTQMAFSNDGVNFSTPEAFNSTKAWSLVSSKGAKTVWVKVKDANGFWTNAVSAEIFFDKAFMVTDFGSDNQVQTFWDSDGTQVYQRSFLVNGSSFDGGAAMSVSFQKKANLAYSYFGLLLNPGDFSDYSTLRLRIQKSSNPPMVLMAKLEFEGSTQTYETQVGFPQGTSASWEEATFDFSMVPAALMAKLQKVLFFVDPGNAITQGSFIIDHITLDERPSTKLMDDFEGNGFPVSTYWDSDGSTIYQRVISQEKAYDGTHSMKVIFQKKAGFPYSFFAFNPQPNGIDNNFSEFGSLRFQLNKGSSAPMVLMMKLEFEGASQTFEKQIYFPQGTNEWQEAIFDFSGVGADLLSRVKNVLLFADPANESNQGIFYVDRIRLAEKPFVKMLDDYEGNADLIQTYWDGDGAGVVYTRTIDGTQGVDGTHAMRVQYHKTSQYPTPYFGIQPKQDGASNDFSKFNVLKMYVKKESLPAMKLMMKFELDGTQINFESWKEIPQGTSGWTELVYDFSSVDPALLKKVRAVFFFVDPIFYTVPQESQGTFLMDSLRLAYDADLPGKQFDPAKPPQLGWVGSNVASDVDNEYRAGSLVRINAWELNAAGDLLDALVQITSSSTGYDSGQQKLVFLHDGQFWPFHWDTTGLQPADDYNVVITFKDKTGNQTVVGTATQPALNIKLTRGVSAGGTLLEVPGFSIPVMAGSSFGFNRSYDPADAEIYDGQMGLGWHSSFDYIAQEFPDGTISLNLGSDGYQFFFRNPDGTYRAMASNNYSTLTKLPAGFQVRLKDGTIYEISSSPFIDINTVSSVTWYITRILDRNQNEMQFFYDENHNPVRIVMPSGEELNLTYSFRNRDQFNTNKYNLSQITDQAGRLWKFEHDVKGNLISETDPLNQKTHYEYDSKSRLVKITYPDARIQAYSYDSQSRVTQISKAGVVQTEFLYGDRNDPAFRVKDALGRITSYTLSLQGDVSEMTDPSGAKTQYFYDAKRNLTKTIDPLGNTTLYTYDSKGNLLTVTDPLLKVTRYTYDSIFNQLLTVTDALNNVTRFEYDARGNLIKLTDPALNFSQYVYDLKGNLIQSKDELGNATTYTYDARGLVLSETNALGKKTMYAYDSRGNLVKITNALNGIYQFEYDVLDRRVSEIDELNRKTIFTYDAMGRLILRKDALSSTASYEYDPLGRLGVQTDVLGARTTFTYDAKGNLLTQSDALNQVTSYSYDALDRVTQVQDALGRTTGFVYDKSGRKVSETNPNGQITLFEYDARNQLIKTTYPNTGAHRRTYDALGRLATETNALGGVTTYTYDSRGNLISQKDALNATTTYGYDKRNQMIFVKDPLGNQMNFQYDAVGNLLKTIYPDTASETLQYDALNRLVFSTDPLSRSTAYLYDAAGNLTRVTDPAGNATNYLYDTLNRKTRETDALGQATNYVYDAAGHVTKITDAKSNITTMKYDLLGRLTETAYPDFSKETLRYDAVGNTIESMDRMGWLTKYAYDKFNHLTLKTFANNFTEAYTYDVMGNLLTETGASGSTSHQYDLLGRMTKTIDAFGNALTYTYDANGNRKTLSAVLGSKTLSRSYVYDANGRLIQITDEKNRKTTYAYDSRSRVTAKVLPNNTRTEYSYNAASEVTAITHKNPAGTAFRTLTYAYNNLGLTTTKTDSLEGASSFAYDKLGQLISVTHPLMGLVVFALDALGNRQTVTDDGVAQTYTSNNLNEYTAAGNETFIYNTNGAMTRRTNSTTGLYSQYQYDLEDQLIKVIRADGVEVKFGYDVSGKRISKTMGSSTTRFVWDGDELLAEMDTSGNVLRSYAHGIEPDEVLYQENYAANETLYFHQDTLMSTLALSTSTGTVKESYTYDPYGNLLTQPAVSSTRFLYAGRELDSETKLYYNRARYYDPQLGRFINADPKGYAAGLNLYAYTRNNPITFRDPSGLDRYHGGGFLGYVLGGLFGGFGGGGFGGGSGGGYGGGFSEINRVSIRIDGSGLGGGGGSGTSSRGGSGGSSSGSYSSGGSGGCGSCGGSSGGGAPQGLQGVGPVPPQTNSNENGAFQQPLDVQGPMLTRTAELRAASPPINFEYIPVQHSNYLSATMRQFLQPTRLPATIQDQNRYETLRDAKMGLIEDQFPWDYLEPVKNILRGQVKRVFKDYAIDELADLMRKKIEEMLNL